MLELLAGNKIGIEVDIQFQTVGELQAELAKKWKSVKNGFTGKINVDVDGKSLNQMKAKIKRALGEEKYSIKVSANIYDAMMSINKLQSELKKLDTQLGKDRQLKVHVAGMDMDKAFQKAMKDIKNIDKAQEASAKKVKDAFRDEGRLIDANVRKVAKFQRINKQLADGSLASTLKWTENQKNGQTKTITRNPNGTVDTSETFNQEKALKEIEGVLKRIHQLEMGIKSADKESTALMTKELGIQKQQLNMLQEEYSLKYKANAMDNGGTKDLARSQELVKNLKDQAMYAKEVSNEEKAIATAVSKVAQLEAKKSQLALQMVSAQNQEKQALQQQYQYYDKIQSKIKESNNLSKNMSSAQKQELDNIRAIAMLQVEKAEAKKKDVEATKQATQAEKALQAEQKASLSQMKSDLKEVHALRLKIAEIEGRNAHGSSRTDDANKLNSLKEQLRLAESLQTKNKIMADSMGHITDEAYKQLTAMQKVYNQEQKRVSIASKNSAEMDKFTAKMKQYEASISKINQLQRDLTFAGAREQSVIEGALRAEKQKASTLKQELRDTGLLTANREKEISAIKKAQSEELKLNRLRQQAKDKDRNFGNGTGGFVDPYSTFATAEMGFRTILESMTRVDEAWTKVNKVANQSKEVMQDFKETSFDVGTSLGVTADGYMTAVEKWITAGKTLQESKELAQTSLVGSFVGNITPDAMVKYMSVPLKAFEKEGLKANDVINVMNQTSNQNAIEMEDLGKAYMRSAGVAKDAGVSFNDLTGMITAAQEQTRMGGERIGTAIKTISLNFGNMRAQMTAGEKRKFDFFKSLGIDLSQTQSVTDLIGQLQEKWGKLSLDDKSTAKFYLAGKEHSNVLQGIIDQWETAEDTSKEAQEQMGQGIKGSAYQEFEIQQESLRFKVVALKNAWDEFLNKIGESAGMKGALDILTNALQKATDIMSNDKIMNMAKWLAIGIALKGATNGAKRFTDVMSNGLKQTINRVDNFVTSLGRLIGKQKEASRSAQEMSTAQQGLARATQATAKASSGASKLASSGKINQVKAPTVLKAPTISTKPVVREVVYKANLSSVKKAQAEVMAGNKPVIRSVVWKADTTMVRKAQAEVMGGGGRGGKAQATRTLVYKADVSSVKKAQGEVKRTNQAITSSAEHTITKTGALKGALGGVLGMIPLLGDAMIGLEMAGVPVFESLARGVKKLANGMKVAREDFSKTAKDFEKNNKIINGTLEANQKGYEKLMSSFNKGTKDNGYMNPDDFHKFKSQFNDLAESMNLKGKDGVKIRIDMNDTSAIQSALKAMNEQLQGVQDKSQPEIAIQIGNSVERVDTLKKSLSDLKTRQEELRGTVEKYKGLMETAIPGSDNYVKWGMALQSAQKDLKGVNADIKTQSSELTTVQSQISSYTQAMLAQGSALDVTKLKMGEKKTLLSEMRVGQEQLNDAVANGNLASRQFADAGTLTATNWGMVQELIPQIKDQFGDYSAETINGSAEAQTAIKGIIQAYIENGTVAQEQGQKAIDALNKEIAKDEEAKKKKKEKGKSGKDAGKDSASGSKEAENASKKEADADKKAKDAKDKKSKSGKDSGKNSASGSKQATDGSNKEAQADKKAGDEKSKKGQKGKQSGKDSASGSNTAVNATNKETQANNKAGDSATKKGQKGKQSGKQTADGANQGKNAVQQEGKAMDTTSGKADNLGKKGKNAGNQTKSGMDAGKRGADSLKGGLDKAGGSADKLKGKAKGAGDQISKIPKNPVSQFVFKVIGKDLMDKVSSFFSRKFSASGSISITKTEKTVKKDGSVAIGKPNGVTSNSVSSSGIPVRGLGVSSADASVKSNSTSTTDKPAKVSENVWRYWQTEGQQDKIETALKDLERAIKLASDDNKKLISLYTEQIAQNKKEQSVLGTLKSQKNSELSSVLGKLKGYGFKVNGNNEITNLSQAKNLSGDKASEAETLLNSWKSLVGEINTINGQIKDINSTVTDLNDKIKQAKIADELSKYETRLKRIDSVLTSISNSDNIFSKKLSLLDSNDSELGLITNEQAMAQAKKNMSSLINEFNGLSKATVGYEENGTSLKASLDKLGSQILTQADAIIKYREAINELEISRATKDMTDFNTALDDNMNKVKNNVTNLKEGLLSGTGIQDLVSSKSSSLDLYRDNEYKQSAKERISLEQEVQEALDAFAKKNVDRVKGVSNAELEITASKYKQMLNMQADYTNGQSVSYKEIEKQFGDLASIGQKDADYKLVAQIDKAFDEVKKKQDKLTSDYQTAIAKATSDSAKDSLDNQYIIDSIKLQEEYYKKSIEANNDAIAEYKKQLSDTTITDEQYDKIMTQISSLEKENMASQNSIKASIKERFEFEFSLMDEAKSKYDDYSDNLTYTMNVLKAIGGQHFDANGNVMGQMLSVEKARNNLLTQTLDSLNKQMSSYEKGSYEWNLINAEVEQYNKLLQSSNLELIDMNKNILKNSFDGTMDKVEKSMFEGKTIEDFKEYHDLWVTGLEREVELEKIYQKISDLGTKNFDEKMALLDKQDKMSRIELDNINKQLELTELQQKLENLNKEKTVQTLKQNANGTWDWEYQADSEEIAKVQQEIEDKKLEIESQQQQARENYATKLQSILTKAQDGQYDSVEEFQSAISNLTDAFDSVVGDFPQIKDEYIKTLIDSYSDYIKENGDVINGEVNATIPSYEGFSNEIVKAFSDIGDDIGETFANALISKIPNFGKAVQASASDKSITINLDNIEFPNITSADGLQEAILQLPSIALQKSKGKV